VAALAADAAPTPPVTALTVREREIARLVEDGLSNKQIAGRLGIEVATVKNHVHNLLEKLQVHRRGEAVARLRRRDGLRPAPTGAVSA
jgi:DNA-binding NarL/FixJ family response regulator